ncbi:helix-turn-helix domain-containing protein [Cronobacter sakazakii]|nr:helix-turn-helix domain-containing protein [Cronobacter malonaticus]
MKTIDITTYRINKLLKDNGWSQSELAQKLNLTQQTVQKWVKGKSSPSMDNIDKLVELTGYPPRWFMTSIDEEEQEPYLLKNEGNVPEEFRKLTDEEQQLLRIFRQFPDIESRNMLLVFDMRLKELKKHYSRYFNPIDD